MYTTPGDPCRSCQCGPDGQPTEICAIASCEQIICSPGQTVRYIPDTCCGQECVGEIIEPVCTPGELYTSPDNLCRDCLCGPDGQPTDDCAEKMCSQIYCPPGQTVRFIPDTYCGQECVGEPTTEPKCPLCPLIFCEYGNVIDDDGCWSCQCKDKPPPVFEPCEDNSDCHEQAQCIGGICECNQGFSGNGKVCVEECSCRIRGDPIIDFYDDQYCILPPTPQDKKFMLTKYRMNINDPCSFMVEVETSLPTVAGNVLQGANMPRFIDVWFGGEILRFDQQMSLSIGGNKIDLPYNGNGFTVVETGNFVVLDAQECGIQVGFEGSGLTSIATIRVPGEFGPELVGMCGNCDGKPNDLRTKDGTNVETDPKKCELIANSYIADDSKDRGFPGIAP